VPIVLYSFNDLSGLTYVWVSGIRCNPKNYGEHIKNCSDQSDGSCQFRMSWGISMSCQFFYVRLPIYQIYLYLWQLGIRCNSKGCGEHIKNCSGQYDDIGKNVMGNKYELPILLYSFNDLSGLTYVWVSGIRCNPKNYGEHIKNCSD
jgi:hypothetical protein